MKAIEFVVRDSAGGLQRGSISSQDTLHVIEAGAGRDISLNARRSDLMGQQRVEDDLVITLADGRVINVENYFSDIGAPSRLFISADGFLNEVAFVDAEGGAMYAQYGPTEEWGKWSPLDDLIYLGGNQVAASHVADEEVSMFAAPLLGAGLLGGGGGLAAAAAVGGAAVIGGAGIIGGGGGDGPVNPDPDADPGNPVTPGGPAGGTPDDNGGGLPGTADTPPVTPFVNDLDTSVNIGGDGSAPHVITVSGGGAAGDKVLVDVGGKQIGTEIGENGGFSVDFSGDHFPGDGNFEAEVTVFTTTGQRVLDGPSFVIDTVGPLVEVTSGTQTVGDFFNADSFASGVTLTGRGEPGASLLVTISGVEQATIVDSSGNWSATWASGTLQAGEYTTGVTILSSDSFGNTTRVTDTIVVDTVADVTVDNRTVETEGVVNAAEREGGVTLTGTAQPGSSVIVSFGTGSHQATVDADGNWSADFAMREVPSGETTAIVTATATDSFGNTSTSSGQVDIDTLVRDFGYTGTTGGADGVINIAEAAQGLIMTGTTEPGSAVEVTMNGHTHDAIVASDGTWQVVFSTSEIPMGTTVTTMTAVATDAAGNVDTITREVAIDRDAGVLTISSDPVETDDIVNQAEAADGVVLTGTADPGAMVQISMAGVSHTVQADADGNWQADFASSEVAPGLYTAQISATTTDSAGNTLEARDIVQVDTRVDNLAVHADQVEGDGVINGVERLSDGSVQVTGTTEVGSTSVVVHLNGVGVRALVDGSGNWTATYASEQIAQGTYTAPISVTARDRAGNTKTITDSVQVDTEVLPLGMSERGGGADGVASFAEALAGIDLGGQVEAGSRVVVNFDGIDHLALVDADGNWSVTIPPSSITPGTYEAAVIVTATDAVGNIDTLRDTLAIDTQAPEGPVVASYTRDNSGVRGISTETNEGLVEVHEVQDNGAVAQVDALAYDIPQRGETTFQFSANVPDGSHLVVTATDDAGNASGTYLVLDDEISNSQVSLGNPALGAYNIEAVDLTFAEEARLTLDEASLLALSQNSNEVLIKGGTDDQVSMSGAQPSGSTIRDGERYDIYTLGQEGSVVVDDDINVVI